MTATRPRPAASEPANLHPRPEPAAERWHWLAPVTVVVSVVLGVVLRFVTLSHLWLDEALSVNIARLPLGDIPEALRHDGHPPLYYFLLHGWMSAFGQGDVSVRALSAIFGLACLPLAWWVADRLVGRRAAWATLVVFSLNPFAIRYSNETRMYSLVTLLVLVGWAALILLFERPTPLRCVTLGLSTGLLVLTHYWGLWVCGATGLLLLGQWWRARHHHDDGVARRSLLAAGSMGAGGLLLVPWLPSMLEQSAHTGTPWAAAVRPTAMVAKTFQDFAGGEFPEALLLAGVLAALVALAATGRPVAEGRVDVDLRTVPGFRKPLVVAFGTLAIATVVGYATNSTFASRYASAVLPMFLIAVAYGLTRLGRRQALAAGMAVVVALSLVADAHNAHTDRTQAGEFGAAIRAGAQPGDVVVICPDQLGPSTERYLPAGVTALAYPRLDDPSRVDWRDYAERNQAADPAAVAAEVLARTPANARIWLVESGSYKTLEGQCETLHAEIATARPGAAVVPEDSDRFEHGLLMRFDPAPGTPG